MSITSVTSAVATDVSTVERTKPGRGEHAKSHADRAAGTTDSFQSDFKSLLKAVQSGDLTSAQSAVDSLKGEVNGTSATYSPSSTAPASSTPTASTVGADLKAMFDAVQAGDVEAAQSALKLFVSDARADGPNGGPAATHGRGGLKIMQALHRHHQRLGLESIVASLFSNASSDAAPVDSTSSPATDDTPVDPSN